MKVCTAQMASTWEDPGANLEKASLLVVSAREKGAGLICFPEQFVTGWSSHSTRFAEDPDGPTVGALQDSARDHDISIVGSYVQKHDPHPLNTAVAIDSRGEVVASSQDPSLLARWVRTSITTPAIISLSSPLKTSGSGSPSVTTSGSPRSSGFMNGRVSTAFSCRRPGPAAGPGPGSLSSRQEPSIASSTWSGATRRGPRR